MVAALVAVASSSNAEEANTLLAITTDTKYESYEFTYNENNLVEREDFFLKLSGGDEVGYDEYFYNEKNQLIRADTYQYKEDSGDFKKVCYRVFASSALDEDATATSAATKSRFFFINVGI